MSLFRNEKEKWVEKFFRFGLVSKGIVYCLIGVLAIMAAVGFSRQKVNKTGIFDFIYEQPFGKVILLVITIGLFGYVTLRFFQAFRDIEQKGRDTKGIFARIGYGISAMIYFSLGLYAGKLLLQGSGGSGNSRQFIVTKILALDGGEWMVAVAGAIIVGSGIYQVYRGVSGKFMKKIRVIGFNVEKLVKKAGTIGYLSRGIVLVIIGYLITHAAFTHNPRQADGGTQGAFNFVENNFGGVLMAIIALGLVGYGIFNFVKAKYQRINLDL